MQKQNYYNILQVSQNASIEEIKSAFRRLARQYHPDLHADRPDAEEKFREICEAYEVLLDLARHHSQDIDSREPELKINSPNADDFYLQGINKAVEKDYAGAIAAYNQAISLNPHFLNAYLKRLEILHKLGEDREVLEDCHQAIQLDPNCSQAYYYRGRSRYRLGSTQAAIQAYNQTIRLHPTHAYAYYYRGIAQKDIKDYSRGLQDLHTAMQLFQTQGNAKGYEIARSALGELQQQKRQRRHKPGIIALFRHTRNYFVTTSKTFTTFILNPGGGLLPAFARLGKYQAVGIGITFGAIANACFIGGVLWGLQTTLRISLLQLVGVGFIPFVSLFTFNLIARLLLRRRSSLGGDLFIAGTSILPLGFLALTLGLLPILPTAAVSIFVVFAGCYTILILYNGCTQISNFSEEVATFLVPSFLLGSGWLFYSTLIKLL